MKRPVVLILRGDNPTQGGKSLSRPPKFGLFKFAAFSVEQFDFKIGVGQNADAVDEVGLQPINWVNFVQNCFKND